MLTRVDRTRVGMWLVGFVEHEHVRLLQHDSTKQQRAVLARLTALLSLWPSSPWNSIWRDEPVDVLREAS